MININIQSTYLADDKKEHFKNATIAKSKSISNKISAADLISLIFHQIDKNKLYFENIII